MEICCNQITLKELQKTLNIPMPQPKFLQLIFPETIRSNDKDTVLNFFFETDRYSDRSVFFGGNRKNGSRAHQDALCFIADQIKSGTAFYDMSELISNNFAESQLSDLPSMIDMDCDLYPDDFHIVLTECAKNDLYHLLLWLILWSVFGELIILLAPYHYEKNTSITRNAVSQTSSLHDSVDQFIKEKLNTLGTIIEVNLAFNHGMRWLTHRNRKQLLYQIIERANRVNILMPEYHIAEEFSKYQRKPNSYYISSYIPPQELWSKFAQENTEKITLKISPVPVLRQLVSFVFEEEVNSALYVGFYTYGGSSFEKNPFQLISLSELHYNTYLNEFRSLWDISADINTILSNKATENYDLVDFFNSNFFNTTELESVDIACHAGSEWLTDMKRVDLLNRLIENKIHINVIITEPQQAEIIASHMRHDDCIYVSFSENMEYWISFQQKHSDFVRVKVSPLPMMHNYYAFNRTNPLQDCMRINFYTYDNPYMEKNIIHIFRPHSPQFHLFKQEFSYLWNISEDLKP